MSGPARSGVTSYAQRILERVDPRLRTAIREDWERRLGEPAPPLPGPQQHLVLAGHRAAGKTSLLPLVAAALGRREVDLDRRIEEERRRSLREWVQTDEPGFRAAERDVFSRLPPGQVVAVGGGFLSLHPELLRGHLVVLVPISFETYRERLSRDGKRPRLRPELPLDEELSQIFQEREARHAQVPSVHALVDFLRALETKRA